MEVTLYHFSDWAQNFPDDIVFFDYWHSLSLTNLNLAVYGQLDE